MGQHEAVTFLKRIGWQHFLASHPDASLGPEVEELALWIGFHVPYKRGVDF